MKESPGGGTAVLSVDAEDQVLVAGTARAIARARDSQRPVTRIVRLASESISVTRIGAGPIRTKNGSRFSLLAFEVDDEWSSYHALVSAPVDEVFVPQWPVGGAITVRVDSGCLTGAVFGDVRCECGDQLRNATEAIAHDVGVIISIPGQEGRGAGIGNKLAQLILADELGLDSVLAAELVGGIEAVERRTYDGAIAVLHFLGVLPGMSISLLTNNPTKIAALATAGYHVIRTPVIIPPTEFTAPTLAAKAARLGHVFDE